MRFFVLLPITLLACSEGGVELQEPAPQSAVPVDLDSRARFTTQLFSDNDNVASVNVDDGPVVDQLSFSESYWDDGMGDLELHFELTFTGHAIVLSPHPSVEMYLAVGEFDDVGPTLSSVRSIKVEHALINTNDTYFFPGIPLSPGSLLFLHLPGGSRWSVLVNQVEVQAEGQFGSAQVELVWMRTDGLP